MILVVDGDILPYELGYALEGEDWPSVRTAVQNRFKDITAGAEKYAEGKVEDIQVFLSDPEGTFRKDLATIKPYKGQRIQEKPTHWDGIRAYLRDQYDATHLARLEGDDCCLIANTQLQGEGYEVVVCSSDKDLLQVPNIKKYAWARGTVQEKFDEVTSPVVAARNLWTQVLIGDSVDNIAGLHNIGAASAWTKALYSMQTEAEMAEHVASKYALYFGSYAGMFLTEIYSLVKIISDPAYGGDPEDYLRNELTGVLNAGA